MNPGSALTHTDRSVETPYRKADRILRMVRRHDAGNRDREMMAWFAAHPNARPVLFADLPSMNYSESPATPRKDR